MNRYFKQIVEFENYYISKNGKIYSKKSNKYIKHNGKYVTFTVDKKKYIRSVTKILKNIFGDSNLIYDETEYKPIVEFENNYMIDKNGNVLSLSRDKIMSSFQNAYGYKYIFLSREGKMYNRLIHRLVYNTWKGVIPDDLTVDHIDENKNNNNINNLQLLTRSENVIKFHTMNKKKRDISGFVQIEGYDNYYINNKGDVISFKYGDEYHYLSPDRGSVGLRKDNKRFRVTIKYLLNKYFDSDFKLQNMKYHNA